MADEQIRIDVTATDDASDVIDDVVEAADELERTEPTVTVDADTDQAARALGDVADRTDEIDGTRAHVDVDVSADTDQATRAIDDVAAEAKELSGKDVEILLKAKIDDARGQLKALRDNLEQTSDKADDTARHLDKIGGEGGGLRTRGQAIADLTGPLGEASSAASDFAGVFDGIGDIAEDVAAKVGLNAAAMSTAIGGIGVAVAAGAAVWSLFTTNQKKACEEQQNMLDNQQKLNDLLREGDVTGAAKQLQQDYRAAFDAADQLGIKTQDITRFLTGQKDQIGLTRDEYKNLDSTTQVLYDQLIGRIKKSRDQYDETNDKLGETATKTEDVAAALAGVSDQSSDTARDVATDADRMKAAMDRFRGSLDMDSAFLRFEAVVQRAMTNTQTGAHNTAEDIVDIKSAILDVAEFAKLTPVQIQSLIDKVDRGDLVGVRQDIENYYNGQPVKVSTHLQQPTNDQSWIRGIMNSFGGALTIPTRLGRPVNTAGGLIYDGPR